MKNAVQFATCARRPSGLRGSVGYCMPTPFVAHAVRCAGCGNVLKNGNRYRNEISNCYCPQASGLRKFLTICSVLPSHAVRWTARMCSLKLGATNLLKIKIGHFWVMKFEKTLFNLPRVPAGREVCGAIFYELPYIELTLF
ncbi:MAG: hypothetical protein IJT51_03465 [Bacteroidales bacterium]|nr:hypothetical protein [Bacteroidales bacterium]